MVRPKLSFNKKEDKATAVADFIKQNVSSISFVGRPPKNISKCTSIGISKMEVLDNDSSKWNIAGHLELEYKIDEDGTMEDTFSFACSCEITRGESDTPAISNLNTIHILQKVGSSI